MTERGVHHYPPGWTTDGVIGTFGWTEGGNDALTAEGVDVMSAWRFCPVCGQRLFTVQEAVISEPRCSGCNRPVEACSCACDVEGDH